VKGRENRQQMHRYDIVGEEEMPSPTDDRYGREIASIQREIGELQASRRIVTSPEGLMRLEVEIRQLTDRLAAALLGQQVQASLESDEIAEAERELIKNHPKRLKSEGKKRSHRTHAVRK
jgi:hypothetical protein